MTPQTLTLNAAIRFSPADSIGVPVFISGNSMYLPEMDADFNISAFLDFENEDGYEITYDVPDAYRDHLFRVRDPAPIIFWIKGAPHVIEGDAEREKLQEIFGIQAKTHSVLRDLGAMLHDARTGVFKIQQDEWLAQEIANAYDDVFLEPPSRTKYWISRYRAALNNARKLAQPPHPIDVRLRRASAEWMRKFATKADLSMVMALLGEAAQGVYSVRQISEIMFAYISHSLTKGSNLDIARLTGDETINALFAHGMYNFYLTEGWPHVPFKYDRPDFNEIMKEKLVRGRERDSWQSSLLISKLLYGDRDAPREVDDLAFLYAKEQVIAYKEACDGLRGLGNYREIFGGPETTYYASIIVNRFERIRDLNCIMHGADRVSGQMKYGRFGVFEDDADECRAYLQGSPPLG